MAAQHSMRVCVCVYVCIFMRVLVCAFDYECEREEVAGKGGQK